MQTHHFFGLKHISISRCVLVVIVLQLNNMELTKHQSNVMSALKQGNEALKKAQQEVRHLLVIRPSGQYLQGLV